MKKYIRALIFDARFLALAASLACLPAANGVILTAFDDVASNQLGGSVSASGVGGLVGASGSYGGVSNSGSAYYFKELDNVSGNSTVQTVKLVASDGASGDSFGQSVSLWEDNALVGAQRDYEIASQSGSAYYYTGLNLPSTPNITGQTVKLLASDGGQNDHFGRSVSLYSDNALIGTRYTDNNASLSGAAYYYKGLNGVNDNQTSANGTGVDKATYQTVKLLASDGQGSDFFGESVSLWEDNALVGAYYHFSYKNDIKQSASGSVYYYKALDNVTGDNTGLNTPNVPRATYETVKLLTTDLTADDLLGTSVSLWEDNALVGAPHEDAPGVGDSGAAYYYRGLNDYNASPNYDPQTNALTQTVKLIVSDSTAFSHVGTSVSLWEGNALVGAPDDDSNGTNSGSAYYYTGLNLPNIPNKIYQTVKLLASDSAENNRFGTSVSLSGDRFVIGSSAGKAYAGDIRTFTILDAGNVTLSTAGISFVSQTDWIIGEITSNNIVILSKNGSISDTANVTAVGKAVYIGKYLGANGNMLVVQGKLTANDIYIGGYGTDSGYMSRGNALKLEGTVKLTLSTGTNIWLHPNNALIIQGVRAEKGENGEELPLTPVQVADILKEANVTLKAMWNKNLPLTVTPENAERLISTSTSEKMEGYTIVTVNPEPGTYALFGGILLAGLLALRRRKRKTAPQE